MKQKLDWLKKITAKQIAAMCVMMVVIYFVAPLAGNISQEEVNMVGSMGETYEDVQSEMMHTVFAMHTSGYLVKTEVPVNTELSGVETVFNALQTQNEELHQNVNGLIPAGAVLRDFTTENGSLTLNVSESFLYYPTSVEENLLATVVWSMTALPYIDRVYFQIEGEPVQNLNSSIDVGRGLTRAMGINLEIDTPHLVDTKMMLLYFFTDDAEDALLVPVSRLVDANVDPFEHAVTSLVRGPIGANYISVFNHRAALLEQPKLENGIMTLNFSSDLFFDAEETQVSSQVIKQLVMTMTEFEEVSEVSVVIEGSSRVFDDVGNPITVPVSRQFVMEGTRHGNDFIEEY